MSPHKLWVWKDKLFHWRYAVVAANGRVVDNPRDSYYSRGYAVKRAVKAWGLMEVVHMYPIQLTK